VAIQGAVLVSGEAAVSDTDIAAFIFSPAGAVAALAIGIVANHLVIGRTCFVRESSVFDGSGIGSSLIASRLPFSDALAW
jgi:hypothetical protein